MVTQEELVRMKERIDLLEWRSREFLSEAEIEVRVVNERIEKLLNSDKEYQISKVELYEIVKKVLNAFDEIKGLVDRYRNYSRMLEEFIPPEFFDEKA